MRRPGMTCRTAEGAHSRALPVPSRGADGPRATGYDASAERQGATGGGRVDDAARLGGQILDLGDEVGSRRLIGEPLQVRRQKACEVGYRAARRRVFESFHNDFRPGLQDDLDVIARIEYRIVYTLPTAGARHPFHSEPPRLGGYSQQAFLMKFGE